MAASDIVALTSKNEGAPVSITEAMACERACISANVGGVSDIVENYKSGIVPKSVVEESGNDLLELITNEDFRDELGKKGKSRSLELFNFEVLVKNMERVYKSI